MASLLSASAADALLPVMRENKIGERGHQTQTTTEMYLKMIDDDLAVGLPLLGKRDAQGNAQAKGIACIGNPP